MQGLRQVHQQVCVAPKCALGRSLRSEGWGCPWGFSPCRSWRPFPRVLGKDLGADALLLWPEVCRAARCTQLGRPGSFSAAASLRCPSVLGEVGAPVAQMPWFPPVYFILAEIESRVLATCFSGESVSGLLTSKEAEHLCRSSTSGLHVAPQGLSHWLFLVPCGVFCSQDSHLWDGGLWFWILPVRAPSLCFSPKRSLADVSRVGHTSAGQHSGRGTGLLWPLSWAPCPVECRW